MTEWDELTPQEKSRFWGAERSQAREVSLDDERYPDESDAEYTERMRTLELVKKLAGES